MSRDISEVSPNDKIFFCKGCGFETHAMDMESNKCPLCGGEMKLIKVNTENRGFASIVLGIIFYLIGFVILIFVGYKIYSAIPSGSWYPLLIYLPAVLVSYPFFLIGYSFLKH